MLPRGTRVFAIAFAALLAIVGLAGQQSKWISVGADGRLRYATDERGNRIMDFSHAGYKG